MFRENWRAAADNAPLSAGRHRVRRWLSWQDVIWHIEESAWFVDVTTGGPISLQEASQIVAALKGRTYQNTVASDPRTERQLASLETVVAGRVAKRPDGGFSFEWSAGADGGEFGVTLTLQNGLVTLLSAYVFEV